MDQGISVKTMIGLLGVALLGGCGQYLGDQRFEHVRLVTTKPGDAAEPYDGAGPYPYGRYLEVEFSSPLDLTPVAMHNAIYVHSDYCPDPDRRRVSAFGPYADGAEIAEEHGELVEDAPRKVRGPRSYTYVPGPVRQLKPDARDGRYHYTAYLLPSHPMPGVRYGESNLARPRYDLAAKPGDICLRLFAPGYNLIKSRSGVVIVPASRIAAALKTAPASR